MKEIVYKIEVEVCPKDRKAYLEDQSLCSIDLCETCYGKLIDKILTKEGIQNLKAEIAIREREVEQLQSQLICEACSQNQKRDE